MTSGSAIGKEAVVKVAASVERADIEVLGKIEEFRILVGCLISSKTPCEQLRYLNDVGQMITYFEAHCAEHLKIEEEVLFPFLVKHIPRLEPLVDSLGKEHEELRVTVKNVRQSYEECCQKAGEGDAGFPSGALSEWSMRMTFIMRAHAEAEQKTIHSAIVNELKSDELESLGKKLHEYGNRQKKRG